MRRSGVLLAVVIAMLAIVVFPSSSWAETTGNVNFVLGLKALDEDDWAPVEDQGEFGALISWGKEGWPVHIAIDVLGTFGTEEDFLFPMWTVQHSNWVWVSARCGVKTQ